MCYRGVPKGEQKLAMNGWRETGKSGFWSISSEPVVKKDQAPVLQLIRKKRKHGNRRFAENSSYGSLPTPVNADYGRFRVRSQTPEFNPDLFAQPPTDLYWFTVKFSSSA